MLFGDETYQGEMRYFVVNLAQGEDKAVNEGENHEHKHDADQRPVCESGICGVALAHSFFRLVCPQKSTSFPW
jgi:hypothetical protein